jgi:hypothetical protein
VITERPNYSDLPASPRYWCPNCKKWKSTRSGTGHHRGNTQPRCPACQCYVTSSDGAELNDARRRGTCISVIDLAREIGETFDSVKAAAMRCEIPESEQWIPRTPIGPGVCETIRENLGKQGVKTRKGRKR